MLRILLSCSAALAACTPSPQDAAMRSFSPIPTSAAPGASDLQPRPAPAIIGQTVAAAGRAAQGPLVESVSAAENPFPIPSADTPAEASRRRILSTAFVRVGPDGYLTVELRDGRTLVLRNVVMRPSDYCGKPVSGGHHCGGYADVAAARPGGGPVPHALDPVVSDLVEADRAFSKGH